MPESLFRPDQLNIAELSIEAPTEKEICEFDPEVEISPYKWQEIKNLIAADLQDDNVIATAECVPRLANALRLFPDRRDEFVISEQSMANAKKAIGHIIADYMANPHRGDIFHYVSSLRTIYGNRYDFAAVYSQLKDSIDQRISFTYFDRECLSLLVHEAFPNETQPLLTSRSGHKYAEQSQAELARFSKNLTNFSLARLRNILAHTRICFPDQFETIELHPDFWPTARECRFNDIDDYLEHVTQLKILAAKRVILDETGIHLTMPNETATTSEPAGLPEQRKY